MPREFLFHFGYETDRPSHHLLSVGVWSVSDLPFVLTVEILGQSSVVECRQATVPALHLTWAQ